jgi:tRNA pseudouridine38-40 synthase
MRNIKLTIAYDGTRYHGFQRQNNAIGIQQILEENLSKISGHEVKITGAGRTDAGVHAYGQVINFFTSSQIPVVRIPQAMQGLLPNDIVVLDAEEVPQDFHACYSALGKEYIYRIYRQKPADPFLRNTAWQVAFPLDLEAMKRAASMVVGTHDFSAFRAAGGASVTPVRTIYEVTFYEQEPILEIAFCGNGFLYHMVRNLVGTLVGVGRGKITVAGFLRILESRDRKRAGITAPAHGLYLKKVIYE